MGGFLRNQRALILDRDTKCTAAFKRALEASGTHVVVTLFRAPNCNAFADRFVLSIKSECTDKMIFFGEAMLRRAINEYIKHYNNEPALVSTLAGRTFSCSLSHRCANRMLSPSASRVGPARGLRTPLH